MANSRDDMELDEVPLLLLDLPSEIDYEIAKQAPDNKTTQIMATLSNTCRQLHHFFQPELEKRAAKRLLTWTWPKFPTLHGACLNSTVEHLI